MKDNDLKIRDNDVRIRGNLVNDPEVRQTTMGDPMCTVRVAINEAFRGSDGKTHKVTTYVDVQTWGKKALDIAEMKKGEKLTVEGVLRQSAWEDPEGNKRSKLYIKAIDARPYIKAVDKTQEIER